MNAIQAKPELIIELDRPRKLLFNMRAANALEAHYEQSTGQKQLWLGMDWRNIGTREATRILWASLLSDADDHGENLTFEAVEKMATVQALVSSADVFLKLIQDIVDRAMPVVDSEEFKESIENLQKKTVRTVQKAALAKAQIGSNSSA